MINKGKIVFENGNEHFIEKIEAEPKVLPKLRELMQSKPIWEAPNIFDEKSDCLWNNVPDSERGKPYSMSCPCKKCSAWSNGY